MALSPGTRLGVYEIAAQIGEGGMGQVYRATDTKLTSDESGANEIYLTTFPEPGRRVRVSTDGGRSSRWRDDGTELFFQTKGKVMAASVTTATKDTSGIMGLQVGVPRELFALPDPGSFWVPARGGQRFLVGVQVTKAAPAPIQVVLNWNEAARNQK